MPWIVYGLLASGGWWGIFGEDASYLGENDGRSFNRGLNDGKLAGHPVCC